MRLLPTLLLSTVFAVSSPSSARSEDFSSIADALADNSPGRSVLSGEAAEYVAVALGSEWRPAGYWYRTGCWPVVSLDGNYALFPMRIADNGAPLESTLINAHGDRLWTRGDLVPSDCSISPGGTVATSLLHRDGNGGWTRSVQFIDRSGKTLGEFALAGRVLGHFEAEQISAERNIWLDDATILLSMYAANSSADGEYESYRGWLQSVSARHGLEWNVPLPQPGAVLVRVTEGDTIVAWPATPHYLSLSNGWTIRLTPPEEPEKTGEAIVLDTKGTLLGRCSLWTDLHIEPEATIPAAAIELIEELVAL